MDFEKLLAFIGGTSAITVIIIFSLKKIIENILNTKFNYLNTEFEKKLELVNKVGILLFEKEEKLYDSLSAITYKARNCSRDFIDSEYKNNDLLLIHNTVCNDFENLLYQTKLHIDNNLFESIHNYKVNHKKLNLLFNENPSRNDNEIKQEFKFIENQYQEISKTLINIINSLKIDLNIIVKEK
jgi:hypothetical protein